MAAKEKLAQVMIVNRRTGKALQSTGLDNGQVVVQAAPTGEDAQLWTTVKIKGGVKLQNKASGKLLDVMHGGVESGTWAQTWEDVSGGSQLWQLVRVTATYKKIINVQSGKALDIVDMREDDGAPAQIWDDVDGVGQQWKLTEPGEAKAKGAKPQGRAGKAAVREEAAAESAPEETPAPKRRGRKPKAAAEAEAQPPKRRGRKPKAAAEAEAPKEEPRAEEPVIVPAEAEAAPQEKPVVEERPAPAPEEKSALAPEETPAPKRRGRRPKAAPAQEESPAAEKPAPKRRGRKPKAEK